MVLTKSSVLWIAALVFGTFTSATAAIIATTPARTVFFACDDVDATVIGVENRSKGRTMAKWRTTAMSRVDDKAIWAERQLPFELAMGAPARLRIPRARADLAVVYVGDDGPDDLWTFLAFAWVPVAALAVMVFQMRATAPKVLDSRRRPLANKLEPVVYVPARPTRGVLLDAVRPLLRLLVVCVGFALVGVGVWASGLSP